MKYKKTISRKVQRRKVAKLAAYSRRFTVNNCTIPKANPEDLREVKYSWGTRMAPKKGFWDIPKEGYKQPESLHKKRTILVYSNGKTVRVKQPSTFPKDTYQEKLWKNLGKAAKMEVYAQEKLKKWERKNPKPCADDDLFKDEMIPAWEAEREKALERFRDFVVSVYDKLTVYGRFKKGKGFKESVIAEIKDTDGSGHIINEVDDSSKVIQKVRTIANKVHGKNAHFMCARVVDHNKKKGRIILPKAA